ncbi:MAG TPA: hypothetical protein VH161_01985, partial [Candidatus Acidoferrales bacterium]|nr:hypothetical protein [Candidatus Acidoferrales bacterium]
WGAASPGVTSVASVAATLFSGVGLVLIARLFWTFFEKPLVKLGHRYEYRDDPEAQKAASPRSEESAAGEPALTVP